VPAEGGAQYFPGCGLDVEDGGRRGVCFCRGDLPQANVVVDPETLKIEGIIGWEYAGFWPDYFETAYFRDPLPSGAQFRDESQNSQLVEFLQGPLKPSVSAQVLLQRSLHCAYVNEELLLQTATCCKLPVCHS
jgi:hypothetical protein